MTKQITLTQGKVALVDDDVYDYLVQWKWQAVYNRGKWYAIRSTGNKPNQKSIWMHREIMDSPTNMDVDHIDSDGLNNIRENMRNCTHAENSRNRKTHKNNTSGFKGVSWHNAVNKYTAAIKLSGKSIHLGCFLDPIEAAKAYDAKARELFGDFARTNFGA